MEKNQIIELRIEDMLDDGRAFGRYKGCAVFVDAGESAVILSEAKDLSGTVCCSAVPGDAVKARVTKAGKSSAEAALLEVVSPSPDRIKAECPYFGECGGCTMQELSYEAQKRVKTEQVRSKLKRLGGLEDPKVNEMIGAETLKYYRNKAVFAVGPHGEVGFKRAKSNHVKNIDDCMLQSDAAMVCADALRYFLKDTGVGCISQMTVRTAFNTGEVMAVLEIGDPAGTKRPDAKSRGRKGRGDRRADPLPQEIPGLEKLIEMLDDAVYSLNERDDNDHKKLAAEINPEQPDPGSGAAGHDDIEIGSAATDAVYSLESVAVIRNGKCRIVAGKLTITETFIREDGSEVSYEISPQSFFQVNPEQMEKLYDKAAEYSGLLPSANGIDINASKTNSTDEDGSSDVSIGNISAKAMSAEKNTPLTVLDLYCGAGTIGIWLLSKLRDADPEIFEKKRVIGIESVKPAVIDANRNSVINGLINTRYICGKAEEELPGMMGLAKLYKWNEVNERVQREPEIYIRRPDLRSDSMSESAFQAAEKTIVSKQSKENRAGDSVQRSSIKTHTEMIESIDIAILDPPRAGCGEALLAAVAAAQPGRIVYVSCDPGTLARDIKYLCANGYEFVEATPIDQFPWTSHVETVCLLSKLSSAKHHIEINVDMDELDLTSAEAKATYEEIRNWVQEKYGLHVTNLNIAQVKQKHGIIERENYNKPKSPDSKQPGCPEEKVKAIEEAMGHFQMI